jgi:cell division protease FtsH
LISQICSLYGGRIAEELTLGAEGVTTGASNDIQRATSIARSMVTKWGLSEKLGPQMYDDEDNEPFLGRSMSRPANGQSDETARLIDQEVKEILDTCYATAKQTLEDNMDKLHLMADALMEYETIDAKQIDQIMKGKKPGPPDGWSDNDKPHGGTPEVHDDLQEAPADDASDPTPKDGTAPTN